MDKLTPKAASRRLDEQSADQRALAAEQGEQLARLIEQKGYVYAKRMAMTLIVKPYECEPPMSDQDKTKWETYNTIRWGFERFFSALELAAQKGTTDVN